MPQIDTNARDKARQLAEEIERAGRLRKDVLLQAGISTPGATSLAYAVLAGRRTSWPMLLRLRSAFAEM